MSSTKVIVLTGSNRGLGLATAKLLAERDEPVVLIAASRGAVDLKLQTGHPSSTVEYLALDVTSQDSVDQFQREVLRKYGRVDILINNAGSIFDKLDNSTYGPELVKQTFDLNYWGVIKMQNAFIPSIPKGGRVVNISSMASQFNKFSNAPLRAALFDSELNLAGLNEYVDKYIAASAKPDSDDGWLHDGLNPAYCSSKAFVNLLTAVTARENPSLIVNAGCPGMVESALTEPEVFQGFKLKTGAEGSRVVIQLAFDDLKGVTGKFYAGQTSYDTGPGSVTEGWPGKEIVWITK